VVDRDSLDAALGALAAPDAGWTVAALDYELGYLLEPRAAPLGWVPDGQPLARFWRFRQRLALSAEEAEAWLAERAAGVAGVADCHPLLEENAYAAAVDRIQQLISAGDCYQVNFTLPLDFSWFGSPLALYRQLRQRQPVRYGGVVGDSRAGLVSLSPELFIERQGDCCARDP